MSWFTKISIATVVLGAMAAFGSTDAGAPDLALCASPEAQARVEEGRAVMKQKGESGADEALALYRKALELDARCATAHWEIGWAWQQKGNWKETVNAWEEVQKLVPTFPALETRLSQARAQQQESASLTSLPPLGPLKKRDERPSEGESITLAAVGDVCMGLGWPSESAQLPPNEGRELFDAVAPAFKSVDMTFGNLETVLADGGDSTKCGKKSKKCYAFRVPTSYAQALKEAGFGVMSIANNHAGDFGPEGRKSTMAALDAAGIFHSGPLGDVAHFEIKGRKVAMVAFSYGADVYRIQEIELGQRLVAWLKRQHDVVLVSFHAGAEGSGAERTPRGVEMFLGENRGDSRRFAKSMIDAGADLLLGHGPHVLRGMEIYQGRLIVYSMGNFSAWTNFSLSGSKGLTAIFKVTLAGNGVLQALKVEPIVLEEQGLPRPDAQMRSIAHLRALSEQDFGSPLIDEKGEWRR